MVLVKIILIVRRERSDRNEVDNLRFDNEIMIMILLMRGFDEIME